MLRNCESSEVTDQLLRNACARKSPAELHFEDAKGTVITGRIRLLEMHNGRILADQPVYIDGDERIATGTTVTVHFAIKGMRLQFKSVIESLDQPVRLNARQETSGIALRTPRDLAESQRRSNLRVSVLGYDPISVTLVKRDDAVPEACNIDALVVAGWLVDVSTGGASVLVHRDALAEVETGRAFFVCFSLPAVEDEFHMLGMVRHLRPVDRNDSLRIGLGFQPWRGRVFVRDQQRISRFVTAHERRMLRRRR